jgi:hypothetical protein
VQLKSFKMTKTKLLEEKRLKKNSNSSTMRVLLRLTSLHLSSKSVILLT